MGGSSTNKTNQVNTNEVHTAINNQDLSSTKVVNDTTNIKNYIGGGIFHLNGLTNAGHEVFKLQEL